MFACSCTQGIRSFWKPPKFNSWIPKITNISFKGELQATIFTMWKTLPETDCKSFLKIGLLLQKKQILFQPSIFQGTFAASFREFPVQNTTWKPWKHNKQHRFKVGRLASPKKMRNFPSLLILGPFSLPWSIPWFQIGDAEVMLTCRFP